MGRASVLPPATGARLLALRKTHTLAATAARLNAEGLPAATGVHRSANNVSKVQKRLSGL